MLVELKSKAACIFGLPDSDKSTLAHFIANQYKSRAFIYDTLDEFPDEILPAHPHQLEHLRIGDTHHLDHRAVDPLDLSYDPITHDDSSSLAAKTAS